MSDRPDLSPEETEQIEHVVIKMLRKKLSLRIKKKDDHILFQLRFGETQLGDYFRLEGPSIIPIKLT